MMSPRLALSREVRLSLGAITGFGSPWGENVATASPACTGLEPLVTLRVQVANPVSADTGMLMNIRVIDQVVRQNAAPVMAAYYRNSFGKGGGDLVISLAELLGRKLAGLQRVELAFSPYFRMAVATQEPAMVELTERFEFSAAHRLHSRRMTVEENQAAFGKCNNPHGHGHNYELEVTVAGEPAADTGVVIPIGRLQEVVNREVIEAFDHKNLNVECVEFREPDGLNPTVENIAQVIYRRLAGRFGAGVTFRRVRVWESPKTWAEYGS